MSMEGILLKWTNYLSGWQPRWFVLDNGVLTYYKSQEEVNSGCKGSIKMSVCDISVHSTDRCRLDLIIPGEQHFYIRASSPQDRQQWLVALGTAKASLTNGRPTEQTGEISPDIVRSKKSELRLYCDLLMQQVHSVKTAVQEKTPPDIQKLDEATVLLGATCDTFIQTLEDCMKIANASIAYESPHQQINDSPFPTVALKTPNKKGLRRQPKSPSLSNTVHSLPDKLSSARRRTASENSFSNSDLESDQSGSPLDKSNRSRSLSQSHTSTSNQSQSIVQNLNLVNEHPVVNVNDGKIDQNGSNSVNFNENSKVSPSVQTEEDLDVFKDAVDDRIPTFFSEMRPSFMDLPLHKDGGIPVESFLGSCKSLVPIFDKFNATAFAPVKMDFQGNIRKLQQKYQTNPTTLTTLQKIVLSEMNSKQHLVSSSATIALLWMKRSLEFIKECLNELYQGQPDLSTAVSNAYGKSLKPYHGWVVRGVFAVAVKALPYRDVFIAMLNVQGDQSESSDFNQCLMTDMESYITALEVVIKILNDFYRSHSINSDDQV